MLMRLLIYVLTEYVEEMFQTFTSARKDDFKKQAYH